AKRSILEAELGERAADDRRRRLSRASARELPLRGERDAGDARAAMSGGLADEQERRVFERGQVGMKPQAPRGGTVAVTIEVERRADRSAAQTLDELLDHHP